MFKVLRNIVLVAAGICTPAWTHAQEAPKAAADRLSIEDLLSVEVVSTASKFPQEIREAPASISVITAEDIRRYGHRTLNDVLRSARGLYTSYDRNYAYAGVRGFSRPGDYNTRVLLLLDGHRLNDGVYDMAPIGTDYPIDISLIDRVEIIRGPASSLYGTNAFMAVINVVTRTGAEFSGVRTDVYGGSLKTAGATTSYGKLFQNNAELLLAASHRQAGGAERLHFAEFDTGEPGSGIAVDMDDDRADSFFGSLALGRFSFRGGFADRYKHVPTASFATVFGDDRLATTDRKSYLSAAYDGPLGQGWSATARLAYDYYYYEGAYPTDYGDGQAVLFRDASQSQMITGEMTVRRRIARRHQLTIGTEIRGQFQNRTWASDDYGPLMEIANPGAIVGVYAQDEVRVFPWMLVNAGVRVDRYPQFSSDPTPRLGVVLLPRKQTAVKILHGRAFRAPNSYELYYYDAMREQQFTLEPERIQSTEAIWEEQLSDRVRTTVTAFTYKADRLIEQQSLAGTSDNDLYFANLTTVNGHGLEAEGEAKLAYGLNGYFNYTFVRTYEVNDSRQLSNSPRHLAKFGVQVPVGRLYASMEAQYIGERLTLGGDALKGAFVPNVVLTSPQGRRLELSLGLYNATNTAYADPVAEEHVQSAITQDGRTVLAKVRVRF